MKKMFWKDLFKTITHTKVTFLSILLFVMMGMTLFFGIAWTSETTINSSNEFFNITNSYDIQINLADGYKNPSDFLSIDGIDESEGTYSYITEFKNETDAFEANITTLTSKLSTPYNVDGRLPQAKGEVALIRYWAENNNYKIGDTITINNAYINGEIQRFTTDEFIITALFDSSIFMPKNTTVFGISPIKNVPVNASLFVHESSFNPVINNLIGYNTIYLKSNKLKGFDYFSNGYQEEVDIIKDNIISSSLLNGKTYAVSTIRDTISHQNSQVMKNVFYDVKFSLGGIFVLVGLLVSYFSISRTIEENKVLIGIKKANGFKNSQIYSFYLIYVALSILIGSIIGAILARFVAQPIIFGAIRNSTVFASFKYVFRIEQVLMFFGLELLIQLSITFIASRKQIKKNTVKLLNNENVICNKTRFYQKSHFWNKLSLFAKTIINNFFNEKNRVLSMIVGIGGCASFLVCAFTIDTNISSSFNKQFESIFSFQSILYYDSSLSTSAIKNSLDGMEIRYTDIMYTYMNIEAPNGKQINAQTYIFGNDDFDKFIIMRDTNNNKINFNDGIYFSCSYKEEFNLPEHTTIKITDTNLNTFEVESAGFFEHYLISNMAFMNSTTYKEVLKGTYKSNALLLDLQGNDFADIQDLNKDEATIYVSDVYTSGKISFDSITSIFSILNLVFFVLSVLMALLVVYDLISMFISEKKRELLTLMINGFSRAKTKQIIYMDTIVLSIVGLAIGIWFGTFISTQTVAAFKNETIYFITGLNPLCAGLGVLITAVIILSVTLLALRKINKFKLTDFKLTD